LGIFGVGGVGGRKETCFGKATSLLGGTCPSRWGRFLHGTFEGDWGGKRAEGGGYMPADLGGDMIERGNFARVDIISLDLPDPQWETFVV
jgi:hypothetical protein